MDNMTIEDLLTITGYEDLSDLHPDMINFMSDKSNELQKIIAERKRKELERQKMLQQRQNPEGSDMYEYLKNPPVEKPFDNFERYD